LAVQYIASRTVDIDGMLDKLVQYSRKYTLIGNSFILVLWRQVPSY